MAMAQLLLWGGQVEGFYTRLPSVFDLMMYGTCIWGKVHEDGVNKLLVNVKYTRSEKKTEKNISSRLDFTYVCTHM
jgi:hypothetical protein